MKKLHYVAQALLLCTVGCSPHQEHGGGFDLAGAGGGDVDMAIGGLPVDNGDMSGPLAITPLDKVVTAAPGAMPTVQYAATINGQSVAPAWTIDRGEIGTIDVSSGLFTASGSIGGKATITATYLKETASTTVTVQLSQTQNGDPAYPPSGSPGPGGYGGVGGAGPGGPASGGQTGVLGGAPTADANVKMLYPYDGTVWPRGLLAPLLQWNPGTRSFDAVMVKLHAKNFDYTGTFAKNATPFLNLPIPADVWHTLTYSNEGKGDDVTVTLVFEDVSTATPTAIGPYTMTWHIAPGTLKGTVYYNSYGTALVTNSGEPSCSAKLPGPPDNECCVKNYLGSTCTTIKRTGPEFGAATLAIKPGATDPVVVAGTSSPGSNSGCRVCHSVSTNGKVLFTQHGNDYTLSSTFDLTAPNPAVTDVPVGNSNHNFPALSPDGTWFMSGSPRSTNPTPNVAGAMIDADAKSQAYAINGTLRSPQPTLPFDTLDASLPTFSPDGKHLSYNYWASTKNATSGGDTKSLAVMDYDSTNAVFSNPRTLYTPTDTSKAAWSSFLPTNDALIFEHETHEGEGLIGFTRYGSTGELMWVTLTSPTAVTLDQANGKGYLPTYGAHTGAADAQLNYEPTVNPVPSGGYAWVVFTSRRLYGNVATASATTSDPREYDWQHIVTPKKLWVAAIDLNAPAGSDPSHPAFYLPAQELLAGNSRGFWTVDPCHPDGTGCETGDECCGGYCRPGGDGGALICTNQQPSCSQEFEKCTTTADCCGAAAGITCINGFCSKSSPIP
jgi:hypothetical protein